MPRYALQIEYDGKPYHGWQRQRDLPSVQETIEIAISKVAPEKPEIQGAGRTDAGVHATGQIAHVDLNKFWDSFRLSEAINYHLRPAPISITKCSIVEDDFHARFSAKERRYVFRLLTRRPPAIVDAGWVWQIQHDLDLELMKESAKYLIGKHDFTTFRSSICQAQSPIKTLDEIIDYYSNKVGPKNGAYVVAKSWTDNKFRTQILKDPDKVLKELGFFGRQGEHVVVLENTTEVHNLVVCTLCSCYPWPLLGLPPSWYKSDEYRSRSVREPREVLREFGFNIPDEQNIKVWDSTAEIRYLVLPMRPEGTDGMSLEELSSLVTRDSMIGAGNPISPRRTDE